MALPLTLGVRGTSLHFGFAAEKSRKSSSAPPCRSSKFKESEVYGRKEYLSLLVQTTNRLLATEFLVLDDTSTQGSPYGSQTTSSQAEDTDANTIATPEVCNSATKKTTEQVAVTVDGHRSSGTSTRTSADLCLPPPSMTMESTDERHINRRPVSQTICKPKQPCCNPGSVGHPEYCSRSCHYFTAGTCSKGETCHFCHMSHRKRPMRLDQANRSQLRNMSFEERACLILPIMRKRAQVFGLDMAPLVHLEKCIALEYPMDQVSLQKMAAKSNHKVFRDVLKVGNMNSFAKLLTDADLSPTIKAAVDQACVACESECAAMEDQSASGRVSLPQSVKYQ